MHANLTYISGVHYRPMKARVQPELSTLLAMTRKRSFRAYQPNSDMNIQSNLGWDKARLGQNKYKTLYHLTNLRLSNKFLVGPSHNRLHYKSFKNSKIHKISKDL